MRFCGLSLSALLIAAAAASPANGNSNNHGCDSNDRRGRRKDIGSVVDLGYTKYQGVQLEAGVNQYLGLRYAAPPLGNLRFRAPADTPRNETTQEAFQVRKLLYRVRRILSTDQLITAWSFMLLCRCRSQWWAIRRLFVHRRLCAFERHGRFQAPSILLDSGRRLHCKLKPKLQWHQPDQLVGRQRCGCQLQLPSWTLRILG